jgi:hypothetical protein
MVALQPERDGIPQLVSAATHRKGIANENRFFNFRSVYST